MIPGVNKKLLLSDETRFWLNAIDSGHRYDMSSSSKKSIANENFRENFNSKTNPQGESVTQEKQTLTRQLGVWTATFVVMASMIGSGIFGNTGIIQSAVGDPFMVLALWALGGIVALSGALCYAELSTLMPHAGGEYVYLKNIFGLLPSFLTGWVSFAVAFSAPAASAALLSADYLKPAIDLMLPESILATMLDSATGRKVFASLLIVLFTVIHVMHVKKGGMVQNILTVVKVGLVILFMIAGFYVVLSSPELPDPRHFESSGIQWSGAGLGLLFVMFAYSGWNGATYLAEEIQNPGRNLPVALIGGTIITMVLYILLNVLYYLAVPASELAGEKAVAYLTASHLFGAGITAFFNVAFFFMLLSTVSATIMIGPRVYFAMARDRLFFRIAATIHPVFHTPVMSFVIQGLLSIIYIASGTYEQIQTYMGIALSIFPLMAIGGLMLLRHKRPDIQGPYRTPLYPLFPVIYILFTVITVVTSVIGRPVEAGVALLVILLGVPVYFLWMRVVHRGLSKKEFHASLLNSPFIVNGTDRTTQVEGVPSKEL
jgi:APA family basic amino acid/polyamine antiporter